MSIFNLKPTYIANIIMGVSEDLGIGDANKVLILASGFDLEM